MASAEANKELIKRYFDAMERGALDEATEFWSADASNHASGRAGHQASRGREAIGMVLRMLRVAFPDRRYQIDDLIAEGDQDVCRMTVSGKFGGVPARPAISMPPGWVGVEGTELVGASGIGKPYSVKHVHIFRIANGQITDHWAARDDVGLLLQLGAIVPA
ncbi:MAG TPA: ester cyclase [Candidatus Dormibacteraeota bacterium]|nr:ester cyclase [Candidatus Dormibacteraeota bacterium]